MSSIVHTTSNNERDKESGGGGTPGTEWVDAGSGERSLDYRPLLGWVPLNHREGLETTLMELDPDWLLFCCCVVVGVPTSYDANQLLARS